MRRNWTGKICLALCALLCLSGFAMASEEKVAMGRYVEVPIALPAQGYLSFAGADGAIYMADGNANTLYKCADLNANNWEEIATGHDEDASPAQGGVNGIAVTADGALYLSSGWAMLNEENYPYVERIKGGKSERVQLDRKLNTGSDQLQLCALPSGELMGLSDTEVYRFSQDGETLQKYAVSGGESIAVYENEIAICSTGNSLISVLDIQSGQVLRALPLPGSADYGVVGYDANGALYYVCPDGLYQVNADSTLMMQIADGRLMTVGKPSVWAKALMFDRENNPVVAYSGNGSSSLIVYRYDENVATEPGTMLSVFVLQNNDTLRECANKFQQKYPDVMVDIIVALPEGTAVTRDDAIRTLNTEVLAGKGPDVMVLDGLPVNSYIDKGVLADLSPTVQPLIDSGEVLGGVVGAFKADGAMPAVPTRFLLPSIWGDVEGLNALEDMVNWAQANPESMPFYAVNVESLIGTFYLSSAPAWFTEVGRLDEAKIEAFLTALKAIQGDWTYEDFVKRTGYDIVARLRDEGISLPGWNPYLGITQGGGLEENLGADTMMMGLQKQVPCLLRGADSVSDIHGKMKASDLNTGNFASLPGQAEGCFLPALMMGVSKGNANSEVALKFIAYALGEEMQSTDMSEGFAVNTKVLDAMQADNDENGRHSSWGGGRPMSGMWSAQWIDQAQRDQLRGMIESLSTPVVPDFTLYQMIVQESTPFFEGQISAKQAAQNVCAKANAYLSE